MTRIIDTGALLAQTHVLPSGTRVRLRLPQSADRERMMELVGPVTDPLLARRIVRHDPTTQIVICATIADAGRDRVIGVASASIDGNGPHAVGVDPAFGHELTQLLGGALADRRRMRRRRRAA
ncbi:MAG: hypothetical protein ACR2HD_02915 [Solirubrobacteraceae bacterium]|nr:MAG: hypothetical protein DLM63_05945 [Solirubrobacterales bacterium]